MNDRLNTIVDLKRYPIHDLNSPIIKNLVKKCKEELDLYSCSTIPNFILPKSLEVMNSELEKQLNEVYMSKKALMHIFMLKMTQVYLKNIQRETLWKGIMDI